MQQNCLNFSTLSNQFGKLISRNQKFWFSKYQELGSESIGARTPWIYHGCGKPEVLSKGVYVAKMQFLLKLSHLIALNFGNQQLAKITDPLFPRLPVREPLVGVVFSASPNFVNGKMTQQDYQSA